MRACGAWALVLLVLALTGRPARADEGGPTPRELFEWGEYDSLIRSLEPVLASLSAGATARGDSLELAKDNLWLGVAYWATGKRTLADHAFLRACRLDPWLVLDRLYATPEMVARFESIASRERKQRMDATAAAISAAGAPSSTASASGPKPDPAARPWRRKGWALGALTAVGLAAGGTYVYIATRKGPDEIIVDPKKPETP